MSADHSNLLARSLTTKWVVINVAGVVLYLLGASNGWVEPELAEMPGAAGGGALVWFFIAIPILLSFVLLNSGAILWSCIRRYRSGSWPMTMWVWVVPLVWLLAVWLDFSQHGV